MMGTGRRMGGLRQNLLDHMLWQVLSFLMPLIATPILSRRLGAGGIGTAAYTYAIASGFALLGMLGVNTYGSRVIAGLRASHEARSRAFCAIVRCQRRMTLLALVLYAAYLAVLCPRAYLRISLAQGMLILAAGLDIRWFYFGMEDFRWPMLCSLGGQAAALVALVYRVRQPQDLCAYAVIVALGQMAGFAPLWLARHRYAEDTPVPWAEARAHLRPLLRLFIPVLAVMIYRRMDKVMLGLLGTAQEVGLYESADKLIQAPCSLIAALGTVMLPRMTALHSSGRHGEAGRVIRLSMHVAGMLASALAFGLCSVAREFCPLYFGAEFADAAHIVVLLAPTVPCIAWANVIRTQHLLPNGQDGVLTRSVCGGAGVNLVANALLIPALGARGAALGTVCAETFVLVFQAMKVRTALPVARDIAGSCPYIALGLAMDAVLWAVSPLLPGGPGMRVGIKVILGGAVFCAGTLALQGYRHKREEGRPEG